jgi:hypothetical protein
VLRLPSRGDGPAAGVGAAAAAPLKTLEAELEAFREREANLRSYEERLRAWQAQLDARVAGATGSASPFLRPSSRTPFGTDPELEAAWAKLHRARALMEAEQNQLRDDRMALHEVEKQLKQRDAELAAREASLVERERLLVEAGKLPGRRAASAVERLTTAPFRAAKAVFRSAE